MSEVVERRTGALKDAIYRRLNPDLATRVYDADVVSVDAEVALTDAEADSMIDLLLRQITFKASALALDQRQKMLDWFKETLTRDAIAIACSPLMQQDAHSMMMGLWFVGLRVTGEHLNHAKIAVEVSARCGADAGAAYLTDAMWFRDNLCMQLADSGFTTSGLAHAVNPLLVLVPEAPGTH